MFSKLVLAILILLSVTSPLSASASYDHDLDGDIDYPDLIHSLNPPVSLFTYSAQLSHTFTTLSSTTDLTQITSAIGASSIQYGLPQYPSIYKPQDLSIDQVFPGVYQISRQSNQFPCQALSKHPDGSACEPDRYEIRFPKVINPVYGLGQQMANNQAEIDDFTDLRFSFGHTLGVKQADGSMASVYRGGAARLRTPVLVFPTENIIIAYLQPYIKALRLTRDGKSGCPKGQTCVVMKKSSEYTEGQPSPLVIIKGNNLSDTYQKYYTYLKQVQNRPFKQPNFQSFGNNWETFFEFGCLADKNVITQALEKYHNQRIKISTLTIGSGYWHSSNLVGCGVTESTDPATDTLVANQERYGGLSGITTFFQSLINQNIFPLIGMRHRIQPGDAQGTHLQTIKQKFTSQGYTANPLLTYNSVAIPQRDEYGAYNYLLNTFDPQNTQAWIKILHQAYGPFMGIKHDDMGFSDQLSLPNTLTPPPLTNIRDDYSVPIFDQYYANHPQNRFLVSTNNDWFSVASDWEEMDWLGFLTDIPRPGNPSEPLDVFKGYYFKYFTDLVMTRIFSGYPQSILWAGSGLYQENSSTFVSDTQDESVKTRFVRANQLFAFMPVSRISAGYWHLKNADGSDDLPKQQVVIWYHQLRERLHAYMYDAAMRWHETGVPYLVQPLPFRFQNDPEVYKQYSYLNAALDSNQPRNQYLMGNALLVRPLFHDAQNTSVNVYFPEGNWRPLIASDPQNRKVYPGKQYATYPIPALNHADASYRIEYPIFLKEGELLLIGDSATNNQFEPVDHWFYVFLETQNTSVDYWHYHPQTGEKTIFRATKNDNAVTLKNLNNGKTTAMQLNAKGFYTAKLSSVW